MSTSPRKPARLLSRSSLMVAAAIFSVGVSTTPQAKAANLYWDANGTNAGTGGTGAWNTSSAFWSTSAAGTDATIASFTSADTAFFAGTAGTVTLGQAITIGGLNFGADNFVLTGLTANSLTLAGTTPTITLATGVTQATVTALLAGTAGLAFDGGASTGTLTLGATAQVNSYTGTTSISSGTLRVTSLTALGTAGSGNGTDVISGGALRVGIGGTVAGELLSLSGTGVSSGGALILEPNLATTWSGAITIVAGGATLNVGSGATFTTSTSAVTMNGALTKTGTGTLAISNTTAGGTSAGTLIINAGTVDITTGRIRTSNIVVNAGGRFLATGAVTNVLDDTAANTVNSGGTFDLRSTGTETMGTLTINGTGLNNAGALVNGAATVGMAITGAVTLGSNSTIGAVSGGSLQLITPIAGATFTLTKEGAGTLRSNTVAASATPFGNGSIVLNAGTLSLNPTAAATTLVGANAAVGSTFTYAGGGTLALTKNGVNALTFTIGNAGAAANSVLVRSSRGTLVIQPSAIANLGISAAGENFVVIANSSAANMNGAATAAGIYNASVVAAAANVGTFVQYQGANGFGSAFYTTAITATAIAANTISNVTGSISINTGSNPYALRVGPTSTLTIAGTTTVNGGAASATNSGVGGIILNAGAASGTDNALITGGTLAFGSSEGVVFVATTGSGLGRISSNITGTAGLTKFGPGTLTLDGVNSSLSGGVQLNQGTIFINSATALGSGIFTIKDGTTFNNNAGVALTLTANNAQVWDGNFTFTGTSSLNLGTGAVTMNNSRTITSSTAANTLTVGGVITGSGTLTKAGAGQLTLSGSNTTLTGGVTLSAGTLNIDNANALGTSAGAFTITAASTINNTSGAAITNAANNPINFASTAALTLTFTGSNALNLGTGAVTLGGGALTLANSGAYPLTFGGNVGDNGGNIGISTSLAGVVTLAGTANTFTGTISVTGTSGGGTLSMASIADSVTYGSGVGSITTTNATATPYFRYTGSAVTLINRSLNLSTVTTGGFILDASGTGALALANTGTIAVGAGTKTLTLRGSNTDGNILAAVLPNNSGTHKTNLTKLDRGQWVLTNNNTFTGATTVNAGTLKLDASLNTAITPASGIINSGSALTLGGGTLSIIGATGATTQSFASTALTTNTMSTVTASAGAGGLTVNLGAITRAASSGLNLSLTSSPTLSYSVGATGWASTNGLNVSATTGAAFMTLNGTDWANGVTNPVASTYTADTFTASTNNINVTTSGAWAGTSLNALRFNTAGAVTLTATNANTLGAGGILVGSGAGAVNFGGTSSTGTVSGTAFTTANGELNIFNYSSSAATINAGLVNNASSSSYLLASPVGNTLNVFGTGTTILNASRTSTTFANAYTGGTNISGSSTLQLGQNNAIPFGTSAPGGLSISGGATLDLNGKNQIINGISGLGMVNNSTTSAATFTIGSANGGGTFTGSIQNTGGGAVSLVKTGTGSITLNGQNTYAGATTISQGTLLLNFTSSPTNVRADILPVTALTLGSATLNVTGQVAVTSQSFSGTTLSGGATITTAGTTPAATINLGAITRNAGSGLAIHLGTSPGTPSGTFTTFANTGTSIMGGWAVQGATVPTTWAVSAGTGTVAGAITGLTTFATNDFTTATNDVDLTSNQSPATFTINSLRFNTAGALTLTLAGTNTITTGGILVTATVGNNNQTIGASAGAGNLQTANGGELIINNYNTNTSKTLTINSNIIANAATAATEGLTINGSQATPGTVSLRGTNTYAGPTTVNNAILNVNAANQLGSSTSLVLNNGTLTWGVDANQPLTLTLGAGGGTLNVSLASATRNAFTNAVAFTGTGPRTLQLDGGSNDRMWSLPGVIGNADATSPTSLTLNFSGDQRPLRLSAANTFTGNTTISRGILLLNIANALYSGSGGLLSTATAGNIIFTATGTNRAILETSILAGTITRSVGYGLGQIHWEGNGGFSNNSAATQVVNLGGVGATLTWGVGGFVPTNQQLQFGHNTGNTQASLGTIDFQNAVALGGVSRDVNVSVGSMTSGGAMVTAIMSGALSSTSGGGLNKTGPGILLLTGANSAGTSGATITIGAGTLMFANGTTAIPGSGANITFTSNATGAVPNGAVGVIGDTNPISTLGSRISNPTASTTTGAFVLGAHSNAALNFTNYPNMRLAAFAWVDGATPTAPTQATTYTGTITPANNVYQFGGIMHTVGTSAASTSLILGGNNQLTGARSVNFSFGSTTITANNDYTLGTTLNGNAAGGAVNAAINQVVVGIASNSAFGTGAITLGGTQTWHFGAVNGDRSVSNNISLEGSSTAAFEAGGDQGTSGILANTNQGTLRYLGTLDLGGRSNPNIVGRPRATLFLGDITNGPGGINYTQGGGGIGSISWLTSANGGVDKTFVGKTTMGDNTTLVIDADRSLGVAAGELTLGNSTIQVQPGVSAVTLTGRNFLNTGAKNPGFNTPVGTTLTIPGTFSGSTTGQLVKQGPGTLVLSGNATAGITTGSMAIRSGTLRLDAATFGGTVWTSGQGLTLGTSTVYGNGGTLEITGTSAQSFGAVTVNSKANHINLTAAMALTVGTITRVAGSTLNFSVPTGTVASTHTAVAGLVNGTTTFNGNDWAAANGTNITALATYAALAGTTAPTIASAGTSNYIISNSTSNDVKMGATGTINANTLKYSDSTDRTIDIRNGTTEGTLRLGANTGTGSVTTVGGILVASGAGALTIGVAGTPGTLNAGGTTANAVGELVFINNSSSNITVNSVISNNGTGAVPVVYDGRSTGKLILAGANTFTGALFINNGILEVGTVNAVAAAGPLGQGTAAVGNILLNGGTFRANLSANGSTDKGFTVSAHSTIEVVANTLTLNTTLNGVAAEQYQLAALNAGILKKTGSGTLELKDLTTNANNTNLSIEVVAGTLLLNKVTTTAISAIDLAGAAGLIIDGHASASPTVRISGSGGNQISDTSSVVVKSGTFNGVLDLNSLSETIDGLAGDGTVTTNGTSTLAVGGNNSAGLSPYTPAAAAAGVNATGLNYFSGTLSDGTGTLSLTKVGSGTQIIAAVQAYSGATTIRAGTLQLGIANALPSGAGKAVITLEGDKKGTNVGALTTSGSDKVLAPGTLDMGGFNQAINGLDSSTGGIVTNNPTLAYDGSIWAVAAGRQGAKTLSLGNSIGTTASFSGVIQDGFSVQPGVTATGFVGAINLVKTGTNTQTLSGQNTYSGTTVIQDGSIIASGGTNRLPSTTAVTLGNAVASGLLQLGDGTGAISQTIAGLATSGSGAANKVVGGNASNSTLILNQTGTSTYAGALGGAGTNQNKLNFTLQGGGTLTLNGDNTLAGTTTVQGASTLILDSNLTGSPVTVGGASAGTLVSNQTLSGLLTVGSGGVVAPGDVLASEIATLTLSGGLTLNTGGTLAMQIGSTANLTAPLVNDQFLVTGGVLTISGGQISLTELTPGGSVGAVIGLGDYSLIDYSGASNAAAFAAGSQFSNLGLASSVIGTNNYFVTLVHDTANKIIKLNVDNARFWAGATNGQWNTTVPNWSPVNPTLYLNADKVIFGDTYPVSGGNTNVSENVINLTSAVTPVATNFNNSVVHYTLSGTGSVGGSTGLTKSGTASLTISSANTFTGNTIISGGYVEMRHATALGTTAGSISVGTGAALRLSGGIAVGAKAITSLTGDGISSTGALRSISGNNSFAGAITLTGAARINADADTLTLSGALNNGSSSLTFGGAGNVTVSGVIGSGSGSLVVDGTGVVTLSNAANAYTGQTFIKNGTLSVSNIGSVGVAGGLGAPMTVGEGTIAIGDVANAGTLKWTGSSNESTDRVIDLAGTTGGATIDASGSGVLTLSSAITASGVGAKSVTLTGTGGSAGTPNVISSGISDGAAAVISLIKTGAGVWKLDAASAYTGTTTILNGTLLLGSVNQNFSTLTMGGLSGGAATLALGSSGTATLTGDLTFSAANNPSGATISGSGTATLDLNAATRTFVVGSSSAANGADLTISAVIADPLTGGALTKTGNGTLVLTGANTYAGATTVDGGKLSVSPQAIINSLTINVGTNSTAGSLNFYADGAIGAVNLASDANLNVGGASAAGGLGFNLSGSSADRINLAGTGALTVGATGGLINARALASLTPGSFTLIDATNNSNTATITGFTLGVLTGGYSYALDQTTGGQLKLTVAAAAAGPYYWTGARSTNSWATLASLGTTSNWATVSAAGSDAGATPGNIDVIFTLGTAVSTTLDQPYSLTGLTFAGSSAGNGNVTINAGSSDGILTLGANGITVSTGASSSATTVGANVVLGSAQSWSVADSGQTLTVSGIISGNGNLLTKSGAGTLVLTGTNTFDGGLTADAGTVKANNANSLGAVAGGLTLNNATLQATAGFTDSRNITLGHANSAISVDASQTLTFVNAVGTKLTGSGVLNASGAGKLVLDDRLNANDFVGGSILSGGGTVQVYGLGSLGSGNITLNAATLQVSGTFTDARLLTVGNAASAISVDSGQTLTVSGKITGTGNLNASGAGVLVLNDSVSANDFSGNSVLSGGGTVQVASLTALGTGSITINDATLQATGSLSYSGKNFILGNAASTLSVASADTFTLTNSGSTLVSGSGKLNANVAGILVLDDLLNPNTFSGGSVLSGGGTVKIKTLTSLGDETVAAALKDITLQATETITTTRNFTLGSAAARIAVDSTKTFTLSGNIVDAAQAGALTKTGPGVLELSGTGNTFTGGTTVTAGTLKVSNASGSATGTGAVTVSGSSTTLSGAGTITGTATIGSGSILSPGDTGTAGTLTLGGLTLASGSSLAYQLGANTAASDKTIVTGSSLFTANGGAITLTGLSGLTSTTYNLITYSGTLGGTGFGALTLASNYVSGGGNTFYAALVNNAGSVDLTTTNSLTWNGNIAGSIWDVGVTANTNMQSGATTNLSFFDTMAVSFGDTSTGYTVNVPSNVAPSSVIVNAANDYLFQGAGTISGSTGISKSGGGALVINMANSFTGNVVLTAGSIEMKDPAALGTTGTIAISPGASLLLNNDGSGDIALGTRISSYGGGGALRNVAGNNTATLPTGALTNATSFISDAGKLTLAGAINPNGFTVSLIGNGGDLELTGATISGGNSHFTVTMTGGAAVIAPSITVGTDRTVTVNGSGSTTFNGNLTSSSTGTGLSVSSTGTNLFNGTVVVNGSSGGITLAGGTNTFAQNVTIHATGTLTVSGGTTVFGTGRTVNTNGGAVSLTGSANTTFDANVTSGGGAWTVSSSGSTTVNGAITGSGALTKTGSGTLTFTAPNANYSGNISLEATSGTNRGVIVANASGALGTGAVRATFSGATGAQMQLNNGITLANAFTTTGAGAAEGLSGVIRSVTGANVLTGNVTLTGGGGSSTYRADSGASLAFNGNIGADTNADRYIILVGAGDFSFGAGGAIVQTQTSGGSTGLWSANTGTTMVSSTANTYARATAIGAGSTLIVANLSNGGVAGSLGAAAVTATNLLIDGGTLKYSGSVAQSTDRLFSIGSAANSGGGATLDASGATSADTLSFVGAGLIGFTGMTGIGTTGDETGDRTLTLTGTNTGANTFTSIIGDHDAVTGVTSVTKSGAGTWVLNGSNTYTGVTTITTGTLTAASGALAGTSGITVGANGTLSAVDFNSAAPLTLSGAASAATISGTGLTIAGAVTNAGTATDALNFTASGGTITLASLTGAGKTTFGSAATITGGISVGVVNVAGLLTADVSGGTVNAGSMTGAVSSSVTVTGLLTGAITAGTNALGSLSSTSVTGGTNTITGAATVALVNGGTTTVGGVAAITTLTTGTLNLNGATSSIGTLTAGTVNLGTTALTVNDGTFAGLLAGATGSLIKATAGTLTLSGANTFGGGTTINAGTLIITDTGSLGSGTVTVAVGATLNLSGLGVANVITRLTDGTNFGTVTGGISSATISATASAVVSTVLTGTDGLTRTGGELTLTTPNFYTGATAASGVSSVIKAAFLDDNSSSLGASTLSNPANLVLTSGAKLEFTGGTTTSTSRSFTINESAGIASTGTGSLEFTTSSTFATSGTAPELKLTASSSGGTNRFAAALAVGSTELSTLSIDGTGTWVIGGNSNRFKQDIRIEAAAGSTLGFESGSLGMGSGYSTSVIRLNNNTVLVWSGANTDDISSRLQIPTGTTAKMNLGANDVTFAAAPKDANGAALTSGTIQKSGTGTLKIATAVSSPGLNFDVPTGKLTINGTVGNVSLASGSTLGGAGTVGAVTTVSGAIIGPGNSPGTLTSSSISLVGDTDYEWQVQNANGAAGTGYDTLAVTGALNVSGASSGNRINLKIISLAGNGDGTALGNPLNFGPPAGASSIRTFTFATVGSLTLGANTNISDVFTINVDQFKYSDGTSSNAGLWSLSFANNAITLTAVPEPSTYGFGLGALALAAAAIRRRRKAQAKA